MSSVLSSTLPEPRVKFARYHNGKLELFTSSTDQLQYIAISHVWGKWRWQPVAGIDGDIKVSNEKAKFIVERLPSLVGDMPFWMDTITVNQRNQTEVIATVQAIPSIFRNAVKTIAVREGDGIYNCCVAAVRDFASLDDLSKKIAGHIQHHNFEYLCIESYLQRLWTLQECLLSHTIEFVVGTDGEPQPAPKEGILDPYFDRINIGRITDTICVLASAFDTASAAGSVEARPGVEQFVKAYLCGGTVTRPKKHVLREKKDSIFTNWFRERHIASNRTATEPRDYIFATMPQFPWYHYPINAEDMKFSEIYLDFVAQSNKAGHPFVSRITKSMTTTRTSSGTVAWGPSDTQPEPTSLGDFLKLIGYPLEKNTLSTSNHITTKVQVSFVEDDLESVLQLIETAMRFSPRVWNESHKGGELSKYGTRPEGKGSYLETIEKDIAYYSDQRESPERNFKLNSLRSLASKEEPRLQTDDYAFLEARKTLDILWGSIDPFWRDLSMQKDGPVIRNNLFNYCTPKLRETLLLLAAMLSCGVPLSAIKWARDTFIPVKITFGGTTIVLGLVSKHSIADGNLQSDMFCVGRHPEGDSLGKDLVLVGRSKTPEGLLPDFLASKMTPEELSERITTLYYDTTIQGAGDSVAVQYVPVHT